MVLQTQIYYKTILQMSQTDSDLQYDTFLLEKNTLSF